jgi:hypothetical protein
MIMQRWSRQSACGSISLIANASHSGADGTRERSTQGVTTTTTRKENNVTDCLYTRELADEICRRISEGESLRSICRDPDIPVSEGAVRAWSREDRDGFAVRFRIARDLQLDGWSDLIVDLADRQDLDPRDRAIRIDTRKWLMSKLAPKRYGERLLHASDPDNPIQVLHRNVSLEVLSPAQLDLLERFTDAALASKAGG